jgi:hypothetical protein
MYVNAYTPQYLSAFRPEGYGKVAPGHRAKQGPPLHARLDRPADKDTHRIMAAELVRRLDLNSVRSEGREDEGGSDKSKHLALSLQKAFTRVEKDFGHGAATAVMGIFASAVDDGGITEEAVGEAMLDSVRFMDRNFGFAAGDKLMGLFNRDLNRRVNEYFDNGLNEQLYTKAQVQNALGAAVSKVSGAVLENFGQEDADAVAEILRRALEEAGDGLGRALRDGMRDAAAYLEDKYGPEALAGLEPALAEAAHGAGNPPPPPGSMLDAVA